MSGFDALTPILDYRPDPAPVRAGKWEWILWPALTFTVVAPVPRRRVLDMFERGVLRMACAGESDAAGIGTRLGLGRGLVAHVQSVLRAHGLLDAEGVPTTVGRTQLAADSAELGVPRVGQVFVDPYKGTLWPRFQSGALQLAEVSELRPGRIRLETSVAGRRHTVRALRIEAEPGWSARAGRPSAHDVLSACREHRRQHRLVQRQRAIDLGDGELGPPASTAPPDELAHISVLEIEPRPVYLATLIFVPKDIGQSYHWQICDPFGLGISRDLRRRLEERIECGDTHLQELVRALSGTEHGIAGADVEELVRLQHQGRAKAVELRLGLTIRDHGALYAALIQMEKAVSGAREHAEEGGEGHRIALGKANDAATAAYAALEALCAAVLRRSPPSAILAGLGPDPADNGMVLGDHATRIGLEHPAGAVALEMLLGAPADRLQKAALGGGNLTERLGALVAAAAEEPAHALHRLAREFPSAPGFVDELHSMRLRASHATGVQAHIDPDALRDDTYRMVRGLLLDIPEEAGSDYGEDSVLGARRQDHGRRARAVTVVESAVGLRLDDSAEVRRALLDMQTRVEEVVDLVSAQAQPEDVHGRLVQLAQRASVAVEAALKGLLKDHIGEPGRLEPDKKATARRAREAARACGFKFEKDKSVGSVVNVNPELLEDAVHRRQGTLSAMAVVLVLEAQSEQAHPARRLAAHRPEFLVELDEVVCARGHLDGRTGVRATDVGRFSAMVLGMVRSILETRT